MTHEGTKPEKHPDQNPSHTPFFGIDCTLFLYFVLQISSELDFRSLFSIMFNQLSS